MCFIHCWSISFLVRHKRWIGDWNLFSSFTLWAFIPSHIYYLDTDYNLFIYRLCYFISPLVCLLNCVFGHGIWQTVVTKPATYVRSDRWGTGVGVKNMSRYDRTYTCKCQGTGTLFSWYCFVTSRLMSHFLTNAYFSPTSTPETKEC